jgi:ornithine cyclodeaminase/alanine dehydrogenase-like protein (mu-crystallin family)
MTDKVLAYTDPLARRLQLASINAASVATSLRELVRAANILVNIHQDKSALLLEAAIRVQTHANGDVE